VPILELTPTTKICSKCGVEQPITNFGAQRALKSGRRSTCKTCGAATAKVYKAKGADKNRETARVWKAQNPDRVKRYKKDSATRNAAGIKVKAAARYLQKREEISIKRKVYYAENKSIVSQRTTEYGRRRRKEDPEYAAIGKLRCGIKAALKKVATGGSFKKPHSTEKYLGCSLKEALLHIESKFKVGMAWENWSMEGWHLDHVRPIASFDKSDPNWALEANHYTNLQPLWAAENMAKSDKWEPLEI
jgi:hypothetical protein